MSQEHKKWSIQNFNWFQSSLGAECKSLVARCFIVHSIISKFSCLGSSYDNEESKVGKSNPLGTHLTDQLDLDNSYYFILLAGTAQNNFSIEMIT